MNFKNICRILLLTKLLTGKSKVAHQGHFVSKGLSSEWEKNKDEIEKLQKF